MKKLIAQKNRHQISGASQSGFTLVEMLVVIAIISILAGLLLPTIGRARQAAKIKSAQVEMQTIITAIHQYETEYRRMPISTNATRNLEPRDGICPDFTFGTELKNIPGQSDGSLAPSLTNTVQSVRNDGVSLIYQNSNAELMNILRNMNSFPNSNSVCNPRQISFISPRIASSTNMPGVGPDGTFRDPWGNPYIVTIDCDYDEKCKDAFYRIGQVSRDGNGRKGFNGLYQWNPADMGDEYAFAANVSAMVWSFGPDAKINKKKSANLVENKDNILSWK